VRSISTVAAPRRGGRARAAARPDQDERRPTPGAPLRRGAERRFRPARLAAIGEHQRDEDLRAEEQTPFGRLVADVVVDGVTFHDLRHTAISLMASAGWRLEHIARQVGHIDGGALILRRYRHLFEGEMDMQVALLEQLIQAKQAALGRAMDGEPVS
jgi:hypothetical protein